MTIPASAASAGRIPLSGATRLFGTIGQPVEIIRMPRVMPRVFAALGLDAVWLTFDVNPGELRAALDGFRVLRNLGGLTITMPHKGAALGLTDRATDRARASGAVNLLRFEADGSMTGDSVDGLGFVEGLRGRGFNPSGMKAWVLGTGGAGGAVAAALCEAGVERLALTDLDPLRLEACRERLRTVYPRVVVEATGGPPRGVDLAVNATPCGLRPDDPLPFDPAALPLSCIVADVIMSPPRTALLARAEQLGMRTQPGRFMLDYQIDLYLSFFGLPARRETVLAALEG